MSGLRSTGRRRIITVVAVTLVLVSIPSFAFAAITEQTVEMVKYIAAASAMIVSAIAAAYAQSRIGVAAAGTIAEKPEAATMLIVLQALPEIIVLLGFVSALIISG